MLEGTEISGDPERYRKGQKFLETGEKGTVPNATPATYGSFLCFYLRVEFFVVIIIIAALSAARYRRGQKTLGL